MLEVYFQKSNGEEKFLANCADFYTVNEIINHFLKKLNFKSYYSRMWISEPGRLEIDVGSHTEFFIVLSSPEKIDKIMNCFITEKNN